MMSAATRKEAGDAEHDMLTVLLGDDAAVATFQEMLSGAAHHRARFRLLDECKRDEVSSARRLFVLVTASALSSVAACVSAANKANRLEALLVQSDVDPMWMPYVFQRAGLRALRNTLVHSGPEIPTRVLRAWAIGVQDECIAAATVVRDQLVVRSCALEEYEITFDAYPALRRIPKDARGAFEIEEDGIYLYWPDSAVHLDLEDIRFANDPGRRAAVRAQRLAHDVAFGAAVRQLREAHNLKQTDITGLPERTLRRIEHGWVPSSDALEALAAAHSMDADAYLDAISEEMENL